MGTADVRVTFKAKKHDLNVSTYALVVLLLFENLEEGDILTYEVRPGALSDTSRTTHVPHTLQELQKATAIDDGELKRTLQSLACAKFKVLKKHPPGRDVFDTDSFSFNHDFTSPMQRIKIGTVSAKVESLEERKETMERVDEERKHQIDVSSLTLHINTSPLIAPSQPLMTLGLHRPHNEGPKGLIPQRTHQRSHPTAHLPIPTVTRADQEADRSAHRAGVPESRGR